MKEDDPPQQSPGCRSRLKRSLRRLSERITQEMSLEDIAKEIEALHERARGYAAQYETPAQ